MFSWRENIAKIQLKFKMPNKKLIFIFLIYAYVYSCHNTVGS